MSDDLVLCETRGRIVRLTLNRPESLNALTPELLAALQQALAEVAEDARISVVILGGAGRAFSAGVDLKALQAAGVDLSAGDVGGALNERARGVIRRIETMPQAVIAAVNGFCFTGALELALACDLILVAEEARLGDTHAVLGFRPTWGMTQRLPRAVGLQRARELSFTARAFSGKEAVEYGLALEALPRADLDARVDALAEQIAGNSPGSIAAYKDLYRASANTGLSEGLGYEAGTKYAIPDVGQRVADFLAKLGGR